MHKHHTLGQVKSILQAAQILLTPDNGDDGELTTRPELIFDVLGVALALLEQA